MSGVPSAERTAETFMNGRRNLGTVTGAAGGYNDQKEEKKKRRKEEGLV